MHLVHLPEETRDIAHRMTLGWVRRRFEKLSFQKWRFLGLETFDSGSWLPLVDRMIPAMWFFDQNFLKVIDINFRSVLTHLHFPIPPQRFLSPSANNFSKISLICEARNALQTKPNPENRLQIRLMYVPYFSEVKFVFFAKKHCSNQWAFFFSHLLSFPFTQTQMIRRRFSVFFSRAGNFPTIYNWRLEGKLFTLNFLKDFLKVTSRVFFQ